MPHPRLYPSTIYLLPFTLLCLLLFTQCQNIIVGEDELPSKALNFEDQKIEIGKGEVTILDVKKWVDVSGDLTVRVANAEEFVNRIHLTDDGLLAYRAPNSLVNESIEIEVLDQFENVIDGKIELEVLDVTTINYCSDLDVATVGEEQAFYNTEEFTANDLNCGGMPTGDFEIIFPPVEMETSLDGDVLVIEPNPGGIAIDLLVYRGNLTDPDSTYLDVLIISNQVGCFEGGIFDFITLEFDPSAVNYKLDVLANDEFCTFTQADTKIVGSSDPEFGTVEIVDEQYLLYTPFSSSTLPIQENFTYVATYLTQNGFRTLSIPVSLTINL